MAFFVWFIVMTSVKIVLIFHISIFFRLFMTSYRVESQVDTFTSQTCARVLDNHLRMTTHHGSTQLGGGLSSRYKQINRHGNG